MTTAALPFQILSVEEASTALGVLPQTVRKWAADPEHPLPAQKRGRAWVIVMPLDVYAAHLLARVAKFAADAILDGTRHAPGDVVGMALADLEVPDPIRAAAFAVAATIAEATR